MKNLNAYDQQQFQSLFTKTDVYNKLTSLYDRVSFEKFFESIDQGTPRQMFSTSSVSAVPWYYLSYLNSSARIVDLGCGSNFFKPYFANLHGISAENDPDKFFGDEHDIVDNVFYENHKSAFTSVFSINALHFHPLSQLRDIAEKFSSMIKPEGRGFLALNVTPMIARSPILKNMPVELLDNLIREQFDNFPCEIIVFDLDLSVMDAWMDGNIRIVFENNTGLKVFTDARQPVTLEEGDRYPLGPPILQ